MRAPGRWSSIRFMPRRKVDLPLPEAPMSAVMPCSGMSSVTFFSAWSELYQTLKFCARMMGSCEGCMGGEWVGGLPDFLAAEAVTKNDRAEAEDERDCHQHERAARSKLLRVGARVLSGENEDMVGERH